MAIEYILMAAVYLVLISAAISDARLLKIPNIFPLLLIVLFGLWLGLVDVPDNLTSYFVHFAIALVVGMGLFALGWFGGGDAKLYAAIALWFPLAGGVTLLFYVSLAGLGLVLLGLLRRMLRLSPKGPGKDPKARRIPYSIAIAGGAALALWHGYYDLLFADPLAFLN